MYLLLEFVPGGELWTYLYCENMSAQRSHGNFGGISVEDAILYAGVILLALEHVHDLGYVLTHSSDTFVGNFNLQAGLSLLSTLFCYYSHTFPEISRCLVSLSYRNIIFTFNGFI